MTMREEMRISAKTWILRTITKVANEMALQVEVAWGADKYAKYKEEAAQNLHFVLLQYRDGGSDATLWFEKNELDGYPGNSNDLRRKIRDHLEKWAHGATQPL
jgi:hypothetical protein